MTKSLDVEVMFDRLAPVRKIMTTQVITVEPNTVMTEVARLFKTNNVHHIPVVKKGRVLGILSTTDINRLEHHFTLFRTTQAEEINMAVLSSLIAREVMSPHVVTVRESDSVQFAADIFRENLFRALPVVNDRREIVGIITPYDLMIYAFTPEPLHLTGD
jgi:CBS-domain-containing membrane protein